MLCLVSQTPLVACCRCQVWDEYFVFGFSRNVLSRALSQYSYLTTFVKEECTRLTWDQYCEDPYLVRPTCRYSLKTAAYLSAWNHSFP